MDTTNTTIRNHTPVLAVFLAVVVTLVFYLLYVDSAPASMPRPIPARVVNDLTGEIGDPNVVPRVKDGRYGKGLSGTFAAASPSESSAAPKKQNVYRNRDHAISIVFPDGWSTRGGQTPHTVVVAEDNKGASIVIQAWQLPQDMSYEQYSDQDLRQMAKESFDELKRDRFRDAALESYGVTYLSNKKATKTVYSYSLRTPAGKSQMRTTMISVLGNKRMVQILCSATVSYYKSVEELFQRSYGSFLFEDPSWYKHK
jgi:hypothetical protein